jgi:hypothetical protein
LTLANSLRTSFGIHAFAFPTNPAASNCMHVIWLKNTEEANFICAFLSHEPSSAPIWRYF